jgi:5-methylcytosine-specific restriction protein A
VATRPPTRCSQCKRLHIGIGRCSDCSTAADRARGSFRQRGYDGAAWQRARRACLNRDPVCVVCRTTPACVADHYPEGRAVLVARGVADPDALHRLRGLCRSCHSRATAKHQPGGWNRRD